MEKILIENIERKRPIGDLGIDYAREWIRFMWLRIRRVSEMI